jgi:hypothetical protein
MTSARSYQPTLSPEEAMDELRNAARAGQLDSELVDSFIALLQREGPSFAEDADFEMELDFERRVRKIAAPRSAESAARQAPLLPARVGLADLRSGIGAGIGRLRERALNR